MRGYHRPSLPPTTVHLTVGGQQYALGFGGAPSERAPHLEVAIGRPVAIAVSIDATPEVYVGDVWLTVNSYPSGFGWGHPTGSYELLVHAPGPLADGHQVTTSWTSATLFGTNALDLTINFAVGHAGIGSVLTHFELTQ